MADYTLIDDYVGTLRGRVTWRRDIDDVIAEIEDHLHSAVARFEARGSDHREAQRRTLERFGDPAVLAVAFASTPEGGIAVPTTFTRTSGTLAIIGAGLWLVFAAMQLLATWAERLVGRWEGIPQVMFGIATLALVGAAWLTVVLLIGLQRRHGGLGLLGTVGIVLAGVGAIASIMSWALTIWGSLLLLGTALVVIAARGRDVAPRAPMLLLGGGLAAGGAVWAGLRALRVGAPNVWGDYVVVNLIGTTLGSVLVAAGLYGVGMWLRGEEPADLGQPDVAMPA